jgi:hypothetical protein
MVKSRRGLGKVAGALALGMAAAGCSGADVSAGTESSAVNLGRCFGADCGIDAQALAQADVVAEPCGSVAGKLEDQLVFERVAPGATVTDATQGDDGSVWALVRVTENGQLDSPIELTLAHYSNDGKLLQTRLITTLPPDTNAESSLVLDSTGSITLGVYTIFAENADVEPTEELELSSFDQELAALGGPRRFRGMASPHLFGGAAGSVWLAGNADANAAHGVVSRITKREPDWIQTRVPSAGQGVLGVTGLSVASDGTSAVIASLSPKWSGGPDLMTLGVSTFDAQGRPAWTLELPHDYTSGYPPAIAGSAEGTLFVAGAIEEGQSIAVRAISRDGEALFAYTLAGNSSSVEMRGERVFVSTFRSLAVIAADGSSCRQFPLAGLAAEEAAPAEPWQPDRDYVLATGGDLMRFRVPE